MGLSNDVQRINYTVENFLLLSTYRKSVTSYTSHKYNRQCAYMISTAGRIWDFLYLAESKVLQYFGKGKHCSTVAPGTFVEVMKVTDHTGQWNIELAWYSPMAKSTASKSTLLNLFNLAWSWSFLQLERNFSNHLVTEVWSTAPLFVAQQMFFIASAALWPSSNS